MMMKKTRKINRPYLSIPITLDEALNSLTDAGDIPPSSHLAELSDLPPEALKSFTEVWQEIETEKRRKIIPRLAELAEENVEFNYDGIFKLGLEDVDPQVRLASVNGLWENCQSWLQRKLILMAKGDPCEEVRVASVQALERFCLDAELNNRQESKQLLSSILISIFKNPDESDHLRRRSLEAVSPLDMAEARHAIEQAFQSNNRELEVGSVYAMGASCNPSWLPSLLPQLQTGDAELRYEAARACGKIGEEDAISYLVPLLEDEDKDVQMAAIQALGKIGGKEAREILLGLLESADELLRDSARQAIYELELYNDPFSANSLKISEDDL